MTEQPQVEKDIRKITQEELAAKADSIYEAVMVVSRRARQIRRVNRESFEKVKKELGDDRSDSEKPYFSDEEIDLPKYERPERVAIHEFLDDKLKYEYVDISKADK